jgi:cytochrome P450
MARVEMTCVLEALTEQMPRLRLDPAYPPPQVVGATFRSPDRLMVRWD